MSHSKDYKTTLNLPNTPFPMKANLSIQEPEILKKWEKENLYEKIVKKNKGKSRFILHDGPPYANSPIHIGTALNKILKDFVIKYKNMSGYLCEYVPGWDCHGLPIELQALKKAETSAATPLEIRKLCREHAEKFINIQREQFKRLGVLGEWQNPYLTMDFQYEADIVKELAALSEKGLLLRAKKAIHWCASCQTALAEAEIEYEEKTSPSIYVKFQLSEESSKKLSSSRPELANKKIYVLIWTTTPWTLPANQAIALHPEFIYVAVDTGNEILILAEALMDAVQRECGLGQSKIISRFKTKDLTELHYRHPLFSRELPIVTADFVTTEDGTGCVHIAPGHGEDDYFLGLKHHLDIYSPVDHRGRFTADLPEEGAEWEGRLVFEANPMITEKLNTVGLLLKEGTVRHSYPHCWRCKKPVIFRATEQWFVIMDEGGLRKKALDWIDRVEWIPSWGKKRIQGMMETRPDWCLSRQRMWGVPIPVLYCKKCNYAYNDPIFMRGIAKQFEKKGGDFWFTSDVEDLIPSKMKCPECGGKEFEKEKDILDVWFDSGCSFAAVLEKRKNLNCPANLYLEGSDQHRGWFHTSLLISTATREIAPYKAVLTHGFVVDSEGRKMSKSLGNVVEPEKVISQHGAEILRLWVASENYQYDIHCSDDLIKRCSEVYRKIRNTCRHILGNISDFNPKRDAIPYAKLFEIDQYALLKLQRFIEKAKKAYEQYEFHTFFHALNNYCVIDLSAFYLDILKDRLYTYAAKSKERRSAQTALHEILLSMTQWMAPILPFTAEEVYQHIPGRKEKSVHLTDLPEIKKEYLNTTLEKRWEQLLELRQLVSKALEEARAKKSIGNSLEAKITLHLPSEWMKIIDSSTTDLGQLFIVSQVNKIAIDSEELKIEVATADGQKCQRCWIWSLSVTESQPVCEKCKRV